MNKPSFLFSTARRLAAASGLMLAMAGAWAQTVTLATTEGNIRIELDAEKAPGTVANFLQYVKSGHYNGTIFHRVIDGFMIQTGGYTANLAQKPTRPAIKLESRNGLKNDKGTVAMARSAHPDSATSQFFINVVDNPGLDADNARDGMGYAVFGRVIEGMDVVDKIRAIPTVSKSVFENLPSKPVIINKAFVEPKK